MPLSIREEIPVYSTMQHLLKAALVSLTCFPCICNVRKLKNESLRQPQGDRSEDTAHCSTTPVQKLSLPKVCKYHPALYCVDGCIGQCSPVVACDNHVLVCIGWHNNLADIKMLTSIVTPRCSPHVWNNALKIPTRLRHPYVT